MSYVPPRAHLLMARAKAATSSGTATILLKIPAGNRVIAGGIGWFNNYHADDSVEVYITDEDNILGEGAGTIVSGYTDVDVPADSKGHYFKPDGTASIDPIAEIGEITAGLYLKIIATKGDSSADTFRANINWGTKL